MDIDYYQLLMKRILDIVFSILMIVFLVPAMIMISFAIKIDSKGPLIFKQARLGRYGKPFILFKFRTMVVGAENMGTGLFNYKNDGRVTRVGKVLRLISLDELPQLFNIFKGEMAFVGPRPPVTYEYGRYEAFSDKVKKRFVVRPGITGYAQIKGRNELSWDEKVKYDIEYIDKFKKWGLILDFKILIVTFTKIVAMQGVYEIKKD
ncbi:MAG: sugar transferase [Candidatus Paceibacterota bacterium]